MSTIKSVYLQHLNGTTPNATMDTNGNFTVGGTVSGASSNMFRNRIINGDMRIDQRNAGASVTYDGSANYSIDRYYSSEIGNGSFTVQRVADAPAGFTHSLKVTVTAAQTGTLNAGTMQLIEGFNIADFAWGTASAKSITVSFWIKSSVTGIMSGAIQNSGNARSYVFSYTVDAANTWEYKTVTITGDTSGTWNTDNTTGLNIRFSHGSSITSTANSWSSNDYRGLTGGTYVIQTNGATWQITGLQIEVGTAATPFEFRHYTTELQLCQRYYQLFSNFYIEGYASSSTVRAVTIPVWFPVQMRTTPTRTVITAGTLTNIRGNSTSYAGLGINGLTSTFASASIETAAAGLAQCSNQTESMSAEL